MDRSRKSTEELSSGDKRNGLNVERSGYSVEEIEKGQDKAIDKQIKHSAPKPHNMGRRVSSLQTFDPKDREKYRDIFKELRMKVDDCLTKDPNLKEEQVKIILQSFSSLDENGDGKISKREIARAYKLAGFTPTKTELDKIVQEHDENDDGYIDFEEYFNVMRTKMIKMDFEKDRLKTAFKVIDIDQDGFITAEELGHALSKTGDHFTDEEIKDIITRADKNEDGKIDYEEFVEAELCKSVF